jgi:hypothetical protein
MWMIKIKEDKILEAKEMLHSGKMHKDIAAFLEISISTYNYKIKKKLIEMVRLDQEKILVSIGKEVNKD